MHRILVLGATGLIGRALVKELSNDFEVWGTYYKSEVNEACFHSIRLSIDEVDKIRKILDEINPSYIISCLRGEPEKQLVFHTALGSYLRNTNIKLVFCSTANVFDNDRSGLHLEDLSPNPMSDYGKTKYECEKVLEKAMPGNIIIVRLPQIWAKECERIREILECERQGKKITVYENIYLNTNSDTRVAKQISAIIYSNERGIFHLGSKDLISHKELYETIVNRLGLSIDKLLMSVKSSSELEYFDVTTQRNQYKFYISEVLSDIFDE